MIQRKYFSFGGLTNYMYVHPQLGYVTEPKLFAKIIDSSDRHIRRLVEQHKLAEQGLVAEDVEFRTKMSETSSPEKGGRPSGTLITTKGMIYIAMLLRTEVALDFRNQVLAHIEEESRLANRTVAEVMAETDVMLEKAGYTRFATGELVRNEDHAPPRDGSSAHLARTYQ